MGFSPFRTPIDFVILNGIRTPGTATVKKADAPRHWDKRGGYGMAGSFPVGGWRELTEFDVEIRLTTNADWDYWWSKIDPIIARDPPGKRPKAINVWHPWLASKKVQSAVMQNELQPTLEDVSGIWLITLQMLEWRRPKIVLAKPDAAAPTTPQDPIDAQILANTKQIQALAGG